jgi:hypothetical protein
MYPRDPAGPIGETANCQCVQVAIKLRPAKAGDLKSQISDWSAAIRALSATVTWDEMLAARAA